MKRYLTLAILVGCTQPAARPEKVFDFADRPLGARAAASVGSTPKAQLRAVLDAVQPRLAACATDVAPNVRAADAHASSVVAAASDGDAQGAASPSARASAAASDAELRVAGVEGRGALLEVTLRIALDRVDAPVLEDADATFAPDERLARCARAVLRDLDVSDIFAREDAVWIVHAPFVVGAHS